MKPAVSNLRRNSHRKPNGAFRQTVQDNAHLESFVCAQSSDQSMVRRLVRDNYFVFAWANSNEDGQPDGDELRASSKWWGLAKLISDDAYTNANNVLGDVQTNWIAFGWHDAALFMRTFRTHQPIPGTTRFVKHITNKTERLTHNTGAMWNANGVATIWLYSFAASSGIANRIRASVTFEGKVRKSLTDAKTTVQAYQWLPGEELHTFAIPVAGGMSFGGINNLALALGKVELRHFTLHATVRKSDLELTRLDIEGKVNDLYDFDYDTPGAIAGLFVRAAATVQAGYSKDVPGKVAGGIFEVEVDLAKQNHAFQFNFQ